MEECHRPDDDEEEFFENDDKRHINNNIHSPPPTIIKSIFNGGRFFDAFMMEAAQLVGQSLLSLPWIFSLMGYASSIFFILFFSILSIWTNHLVITMLNQYRYEIEIANDIRSQDIHYVASYHDVISHFCGRNWGIFTLVTMYSTNYSHGIKYILITR